MHQIIQELQTHPGTVVNFKMEVSEKGLRPVRIGFKRKIQRGFRHDQKRAKKTHFKAKKQFGESSEIFEKVWGKFELSRFF
jgi:hypothetical protein